MDLTHKTWSPNLSSQVIDNNMIKSAVLRLTYRQGPNKFAAYLDRIIKFRGHECGSNVMEEVCGIRNPRIYYTAQAKYSSTLTNRLLVEGGLSLNNETYSTSDPQPSVKFGDIPRSELTGVVGGAPSGGSWSAVGTTNFRWPNIEEVLSGSAAYVTGSHAFKSGIQIGRGHEARHQFSPTGVGLSQRYRIGVPDSVSVNNSPTFDDNWAQYDIGIFAQDSWTLNHLTINPGIRFELFNSYYPAQTAPAGRFIGARSFAAEAESEQPHWKDVAPRIGAVYDLFGDNTTAVKASWGRYVRTYHGGFSSAYNPMVLTADTRTWKDWNLDDIAQGDLSCDIAQTWSSLTVNVPGCEIGPPTTDIGTRATQAPEKGIKRPVNTEFGASIQRQVIPGVSLSFGYTRRDYQRSIYTQNLAVTPLGADIATTNYTATTVPNPCATANPLCDAAADTQPLIVYNLNPLVLGQTNQLDRNSPNNKRMFNAFDLSFQSRVLGGTIFGGASWGQQTLRTCDVGNPNSLRFCDQTVFGMPYQAQYKLSGSYPLPFGVGVSGSFRSEPGGGPPAGSDNSQGESYSISQSIFKAGTGQTLTQTSVAVALIQPGMIYLPRLSTVDIRLSKRVQIGRYRVQGQMDIFNALNANPVTGYTTTYGSTYKRVSSILSARLFQVGGTFTF